MLEQVAIEELADRLYGEAGLRADAPASPFRLAMSLLGERAVRRFRDEDLRLEAYLARVGGEWRIYLREGLSPVRSRFNLGHEIAEWALRREGIRDGHGMDVESSADALAAALLAPRPFATSACRARGGSWTQLALDFGCTESCAALRYGEVTGEPLALVTPASIRERGAPAPWPEDSLMRSAAPCPGVVKVRLRDDPNRIVVTRSVLPRGAAASGAPVQRPRRVSAPAHRRR